MRGKRHGQLTRPEGVHNFSSLSAPARVYVIMHVASLCDLCYSWSTTDKRQPRLRAKQNGRVALPAARVARRELYSDKKWKGAQDDGEIQKLSSSTVAVVRTHPRPCSC